MSIQEAIKDFGKLKEKKEELSRLISIESSKLEDEREKLKDLLGDEDIEHIEDYIEELSESIGKYEEKIINSVEEIKNRLEQYDI